MINTTSRQAKELMKDKSDDYSIINIISNKSKVKIPSSKFKRTLSTINEIKSENNHDNININQFKSKQNYTSKYRTDRITRSVSNTPMIVEKSNEKILPLKKLNLPTEFKNDKFIRKNIKNVPLTSQRQSILNKNNISNTNIDIKSSKSPTNVLKKLHSKEIKIKNIYELEANLNKKSSMNSNENSVVLDESFDKTVQFSNLKNQFKTSMKDNNKGLSPEDFNLKNEINSLVNVDSNKSDLSSNKNNNKY